MTASRLLEERLLEEIMTIPVVDVHSHVPAQAPVAENLGDLLGYHYYTELAHSSGMDREEIVARRPAERMIPGLLEAMRNIDNTVQYSWLIELAQALFGFPHPRLTPDNWERLADAVEECGARPERAAQVLELSHIEKVFLTNSFDEDLEAIDTDLFVPSLRADNLVFDLPRSQMRASVEEASGVNIADLASLRDALGRIVERFRAHGARSLAISLPPHFMVWSPDEVDFEIAVEAMLAADELDPDTASAVHSAVLYSLSELCADCHLPFQVMCGALRGAYAHGVPQGTDLPHSGDTLHGLLPLLNYYPEVTFCLSVLSASQTQELNSYGWIVQNAVLSGHWWYLNVPAYIAPDLAARLQSVPKNKLIGYYSDMYKLEFGLSKFNMYRRVLARVLASDFVEVGLGTEVDAVELARLLLHDNAVRIFGL